MADVTDAASLKQRFPVLVLHNPEEEHKSHFGNRIRVIYVLHVISTVNEHSFMCQVEESGMSEPFEQFQI